MNTDPPAGKRRFPRTAALAVVRELLADLRPVCEKVVVAGSLRRKKLEVGDIEFLYIPRIVKIPDPEDFFGHQIKANAVDLLLQKWLDEGTLVKRAGANGGRSWGAQNKYARHCASEIPVDFFTTDHERWFNMLVCRTGGQATNTAIAMGAQEFGWHWNPYGEGFTRKPSGAGPEYHDVWTVRSEQDVFHRAGLPYREPEDRE